jgi:hypothetical protein
MTTRAPGLAALSRSQHELLEALGIVPLRLRMAEASLHPAAQGGGAAPGSLRLRLRLNLADDHAPDLSHPLLGAVLRVLDLRAEQVTTRADLDLPGPAPDLARGLARGARAKRELWPTLRRLRRTLREAGKDA